MDNNNQHIDNLIRKKFDAFSPTPPDHIWTGIEKGISAKPYTYFFYSKQNIAISTIILLALITSLIMFNPISTGISHDEYQQNTEKNNTLTSNNNVTSNSVITNNNSDQKIATLNPVITETEKPIITETEKPNNHGKLLSKITILDSDKSSIKQPTINNEDESSLITEQENQYKPLSIIKMKQGAFVQPEVYSNLYNQKQQSYTHPSPEGLLSKSETNLNNSHWKIGYYIAPELSISNFDSVQILNSYTVSVEPSYFFTKSWFIRFGAGFSYVRDRGFARISYLTNDYIGSYDDVYAITFDTVLGNITPVYHTKTVEIWDSVRHVSVSEVTNKYIYFQIPVLFGYHHKKPSSKIGWYLMGGPAFNLKIGSWIDDPKPEEKDADIINLQNNLPLRSNNYFQLWFGAGFEYEVNKKLSIAVEPGYRYYLKSIYNNSYNATSSSGFSLRVGLVYNIK